MRIDLAYDGGPFHGFARQPGLPTVQGTLEAALSRVVGAHAETTCAGRTDRGVHAEAQTVHLDVPADWPRLGDLQRLRDILDRLVGEAVTIQRVRRVPRSFDARFSATQRRYRYRLCDTPAMPPLWRHDTWHVRGLLDAAAMEEAGAALLGTHDFSSFCRKRSVEGPDGVARQATLIRRLDRLTVRRRRPSALVLLRIDGAAFCHQMVRAITGTLVEVGLGRRPVGWVAEVLDQRDRAAAGPVAPPEGLSLVGVTYPRQRARQARLHDPWGRG